MAGTFSTQLQRVNRWYERFKTINDGREHDSPFAPLDYRIRQHYVDDLHAFFENCWHLKDWIKNDPATGAARDKVESFIDNSPHLRICGDIANGLKHLELGKHIRASKDTKIGVKHFAIRLEPGKVPIIGAKFEVTSEGKTYDAFVVATSCLSEWQRFLAQEGLA